VALHLQPIGHDLRAVDAVVEGLYARRSNAKPRTVLSGQPAIAGDDSMPDRLADGSLVSRQQVTAQAGHRAGRWAKRSAGQ
jgi:hypothetical protein